MTLMTGHGHDGQPEVERVRVKFGGFGRDPHSRDQTDLSIGSDKYPFESTAPVLYFLSLPLCLH